ncbi:hypothetical protein KEM52_001005 [Ascosphaera acerosa]|nr:hypothetical protein KEM52_001005 [Ascosphaera acerosa]
MATCGCRRNDLRVHPRARALLGDEIYFASNTPWIRGQINQLHGRIDISFWVKGTRAQGRVRFASHRPERLGLVGAAASFLNDCCRERAADRSPQFQTDRWDLVMADGTVVSLLDEPGQQDPSLGLQDS